MANMSSGSKSYLDFINSHMHSSPHSVSHSSAAVETIAVLYLVHGRDLFGEYRFVVKMSVVPPSIHSLNLSGRSTQIACIHISSVGFLNSSSESSHNKTNSPPPSDEPSPASEDAAHIVSVRNILLDDVASPR